MINQIDINFENGMSYHLNTNLNGEILSHTFFQINETLSISFKITGLGVIFGLVASGLWILASIYTIGYMRGNKEKNQTRFFTFYSIAIFAAICIAYSGNLLTLFIFYEVLTFSTYHIYYNHRPYMYHNHFQFSMLLHHNQDKF